MQGLPLLLIFAGAATLAAAVLGALAARLALRLERAKSALAAAEQRAAENAALRIDLQESQAARAALEADRAASEARFAERERALEEIKKRLDVEFEAAAARLLDSAHRAFIQRADETFGRHREKEGADAERRRKALDDLVRPMAETLDRYQKSLAEMQADQQRARGELIGRIEDLTRSAVDVRREAQKLATALRSGAKVRGRWGEEQLRNVVELAGMAAYVDFIEQTAHDDGEARKLPDMVVNLPGGRKIAIDSKVSLTAYLDAADEEDETLRAGHIARHGADLRAHVKALAARDYARSLRDSLDIVVMFVPGENYFAAAMEARPQLFQEAYENKVLIATPMTLIAMLKSVSFHWRQERAVENARATAALAGELYEALRIMAGHLGGLGKALTGAVDHYNSTIGSFERRVMVRARRFAEFELPGTERPLDEIKPIEAQLRALPALAAGGASSEDEAEVDRDERARG